MLVYEGHCFKNLSEHFQYLQLTDPFLNHCLQTAALAELQKEIKPILFGLMAAIEPHNIIVLKLSNILHHLDLSLVIGNFI